MTDNKIIKGLERCGKNPPACHECKYKGKCNRIDCYDYLKRDALDLINRLKAENKELKKLLESRHKAIEFLEGQLIGLPDGVRAEAYKEFAERLKEKQSDKEKIWC